MGQRIVKAMQQNKKAAWKELMVKVIARDRLIFALDVPSIALKLNGFWIGCKIRSRL